MKLKKLLTIVLAILCVTTTVFGAKYKGYIINKEGVKLTGLIKTKNVHAHMSTPCTAGCPFNHSVNWAKGNHQTQAKILKHWVAHNKNVERCSQDCSSMS